VGEVTGIQWTDHTFNPWIGCERVSPGCDHCYAEKGSARLGAQHGLKLWDGDRFFTGENYWRQPLRWNRAAALEGVRRRVFCASFADVFENRPELVRTRGALFQLIRRTPALDWLLLTKRPENMIGLAEPWCPDGTWPSNVWAGTTVEDQERAELRVPRLLEVPARVRFLSYEPAIGRVDLLRLRDDELGATWNAFKCGVSWVIVGGESGPKARAFDIDWARRTVRQCQGWKVPVFVKQLGSNPWDSSGVARGILAKKGDVMSEWPEEIRFRQFPTVRP
jgi:protein gp37